MRRQPPRRARRSFALVPTWLDCVYVGGTSNRYLGGGDVYILGANVGKLPAGASGGMIVSPRDEELLERLDVPVTPTSMQRTYAELMAVTEIMKRPKGTLTVCFPESDPSGELRPSSVVSELRGMLSENGVPLPVERALPFRDLILGSIFCSLGWLVISFVFSMYLTIFKGFSGLYGSMTAIILVMLWLYFCMYVMLLGGLINCIWVDAKRDILEKD